MAGLVQRRQLPGLDRRLRPAPHPKDDHPARPAKRRLQQRERPPPGEILLSRRLHRDLPDSEIALRRRGASRRRRYSRRDTRFARRAHIPKRRRYPLRLQRWLEREPAGGTCRQPAIRGGFHRLGPFVQSRQERMGAARPNRRLAQSVGRRRPVQSAGREFQQPVN